MNKDGSNWTKWDLHIHSPFSYGAYGNSEDDNIWDNYVKKLENIGNYGVY